MTRRLTLARFDKRYPEVSRRLRACAEPRDLVLELLFMTAFLRGEIDRLQRGEKGGFVERVESGRK